MYLRDYIDAVGGLSRVSGDPRGVLYGVTLTGFVTYLHLDRHDVLGVEESRWAGLSIDIEEAREGFYPDLMQRG